MPDDVGGRPFPDGEEPEYRHHGNADEEFATVVFDEDFVRAAEVHEPTAAERMLTSAQPHQDPEEPRYPWEDPPGYDDYDALADGEEPDPEAERQVRFARPENFGPGFHPDLRSGLPPDLEAYEHGADYGYGRPSASGPPASARPYRGHGRWQRPVAWVLAVVMGIGVVALAFSAVYRGAAAQRDDPEPPPATADIESSEDLPGNLHSTRPEEAPATAEPGHG
ncbi:hypothetical protein [Streptomyces xiaopingdaonensis]|uniref:SCO2584 family spore wall biosynthesis protein n=1 Tax=Streptomyces xiaopingdaonensis TaxID=1565415 RepID=UPI0002E41946|nr:hypothetical protein [Streptomyces xiaopingdaonensis]